MVRKERTEKQKARVARAAARAAKRAKRPSQKGQWTKAALEAKMLACTAAAKQLEAAVSFAVKHGYGARKALRLGRFDGIKKSTLSIAIKRYGVAASERPVAKRRYNAILTDEEEAALVEWLMRSARNMNAAAERQSGDVTAKVVQMLRARKADNRRRKWAAGCVKLTRGEKRMLQPNATLSHVWEQRFLARHPQLQSKGEKAEDAKRAKKQTEATVKNHFYGEFGLEKELIDAGIMDPDTKRILDPRRIIGIDETPQMLDNNSQGPRPKAIGVRGEQLCRSASLNRESVSVCMAQDLSGFQYGPQINVARTLWTASLTDCMDAPNWAHRFNDQIHSFEKKSTYLLMSKSAHGVQTAETLKEYMTNIDLQIDARSAADVVLGLAPITRPVVVLSDNHASRFSGDMLKEYAQEGSRMRLWFEESNVSQFLQWLDKINKQFHGCYSKARKEYKLRHRNRYQEECDIGLNEFMEIFGGCRDLSMEGVWFSWCSPQNVIAACRAVGFLGDCLDPSQIDRSQFVDRHFDLEPCDGDEAVQIDDVPALVEDVVKTPPGMRSGSVEALKAKLALAMQHATILHSAVLAPLDPNSVPGLMQPRVAPIKKRIRDNSRIEMSEGGSATMRMLHERHQERRAERATEEAAAQARRDALAARRQQKADEDAALQDAYNLCALACQCGKSPCPMADKIQCPVCHEIKRGVCRKAACKNAPTVANRPPPPPAPPAQEAPAPPPVHAQPAQPALSPPTYAYAQVVPITAFPAAAVLPQAHTAGMYVNFNGNVSTGSRIEFVSNVNSNA